MNELSEAEVARMVALALENATGLMSTFTANQRSVEQALDPDALHTRSEIRFVHPLVRHPLADIANTRQVAGGIASGRWLPRDELDARLAALVARYDASM